LVDGHRKLLQDNVDIFEENHQIFNIFKNFNVLMYITIIIVAAVIVILVAIFFDLLRSKKNESSPVPPQEIEVQPQPT